MLFLGADRGDLLDNVAEALALEDETGAVIDAVLFGTSEPVGVEVDKLRAAGQWTGPRVDMAFASGGTPLEDGEGVLGRNRASSDTGTAADWRGDGGSDAFGPTFGQENGPDRFQDPRVLLHGIQRYVNEMAIMISIHNSTSAAAPYLGFQNASFANLSLSAGGDTYAVVADHLFAYSINGQSIGTLVGTVTAAYVPVPGQSDQLDVSGVLTDAVHGYSMELSVQERLAGFGRISHMLDLTIDLTWSEPQGSFSYHNEASQIHTWVSQDTKTIVDHREYWDWSSPALKVSDANHTIQFIRDGVRNTVLSLVRTDPPIAGPFGTTHTLGGEKSIIEAEYTDRVGTDGNVQRTYAQLEFSTKEAGQRKSRLVGLRAGKTGVMTLDRVSGPVGDVTGDFVTRLRLPLDYAPVSVTRKGRGVQSANLELDVHCVTKETAEFVLDASGEPVFVQRGTIDAFFNGSPALHYDVYIDGWRRWVVRACQVVATGACAAAAVVAAPSVAGAFVAASGSALVIAVGEEVLHGLEEAAPGAPGAGGAASSDR